MKWMAKKGKTWVDIPVDDVGLTNHLIEPVLDGGVLTPPLLGAPMCDRVNGDLVTLVPQLLHHRVVGVLVRHVERPVNRTPVGVLVVGGEQLVLVQRPVLVVDGVVEGDDDHLRHLLRVHAARDEGSVRAAKAIGQGAVAVVARWGRVWIVLGVAPGGVNEQKQEQQENQQP